VEQERVGERVEENHRSGGTYMFARGYNDVLENRQGIYRDEVGCLPGFRSIYKKTGLERGSSFVDADGSEASEEWPEKEEKENPSPYFRRDSSCVCGG
jgi:hypothetical protein